MSSHVYLNGELIPKLDAKLSVYDHGLLFGDGVWEGMRLFNGEVFRLAEHIALLFAAAEVVALPLPFSADELAATIARAVAANTRRDGYIRVLVTRGPGTLGFDPRKCDPQVLVFVEDVVPFPPELYGHGLHVVTAASVTLDPGNPFHRVRSLSHGHMVLAKAEALRAGCLEAVLLTTSGHVAGCTEGHIFAVKDGTILTAPAVGPYPLDVTRTVVVEMAKRLNIAIEEKPLAPAELSLAEELFLAGTAAGIIGIAQVDGLPIGTGSEGSITTAIRQGYRKLTCGE